MAEIHKASSPYNNTEIVDFYLDIWNGIDLQPNPDDDLIVLESKYHQRPELLSYDLYGSPNLWWIFIRRNMDLLNDPIDDFKSGIELWVPARTTIEALL